MPRTSGRFVAIMSLGSLVTEPAAQTAGIRIKVSSSSFPRFDRNLNTGGNNFDEKDGMVARNVVHHGAAYPSRIVLPIVRGERRP